MFVTDVKIDTLGSSINQWNRREGLEIVSHVVWKIDFAKISRLFGGKIEQSFQQVALE